MWTWIIRVFLALAITRGTIAVCEEISKHIGGFWLGIVVVLVVAVMAIAWIQIISHTYVKDF